MRKSQDELTSNGPGSAGNRGSVGGSNNERSGVQPMLKGQQSRGQLYQQRMQKNSNSGGLSSQQMRAMANGTANGMNGLNGSRNQNPLGYPGANSAVQPGHAGTFNHFAVGSKGIVGGTFAAPGQNSSFAVNQTGGY